MTALAAVVARTAHDRLSVLCQSMLAAQRAYASASHSVEVRPAAALGISPTEESDIGAVASSGISLCADIRLDNRGDLQAALGLTGNHRPATDCEILLLAWQRWGEGSLDRLVGDYAFALYDESEGSLILARDVTGQVPLFYGKADDLLFAATMPSGLRAVMPGIRPDAKAIARSLARVPVPGDKSHFTGISAVRPGEIVRICDGRVKSRTYWNPDLSPSGGRDEEFVEQLRQLLDAAVATRIEDPGDIIATHLSSGYDSSAVTATAARFLDSPRQLAAFTSAPLGAVARLPRGRTDDETGIASQTAAMLGIRHFTVRETAPLFEVIKRQTRLSQQPVVAAYNLAWWTEIRKLASDLGARTILTAEMGNLSLSAGGLATLAGLVSAGRWGTWGKEALAAGQRDSVRWRGVLINSFGPWLPDPVWHGLRRVFLRAPTAPAHTFLRRESTAALPEDNEMVRPTGDPAADRLAAIRRADLGTLRMAAIADRGISERDPTADRRLIEFSLRLPPEQLLRGGRSKPLARAALSDRLPPAVLDARLRGLQSADWFYRLSKEDAREAAESFADCGLASDILDMPSIARAIDEWPDDLQQALDGVAKYQFGLTNALAAGLFIKEFDR